MDTYRAQPSFFYARATYLKILISSLSLNIMYLIKKFEEEGLESSNPLLWNSESLRVPFKELSSMSDMPSERRNFVSGGFRIIFWCDWQISHE